MKMFRILLLVFLIQAILPQKSYAYLDPGTGSMVLQIIAASVIAIGVTCKSWMYKIKSIFACKKSISQNEDENNDQ